MKIASPWPYLAAIAVAVLILSLVWIFEQTEQQRLQQQTRINSINQLSGLRSQLENALNERLLVNRGIIDYISTLAEDISSAEFTSMARVSWQDAKGMRALYLYKDNRLSHAYPPQSIERAPPAASIPAHDKSQMLKPQILGPFKNPHQPAYFVTWTPIYLTDPSQDGQRGAYWGMASSVFNLDVLLRDAGLSDNGQFFFALRGTDGQGAAGATFFGDPALFYQNPILVTVKLPRGSWRLAALPVTDMNSSANSLSHALWISGIAFAAIAAILVFILVSAPTRLRLAVGEATVALRTAEAHRSALLDSYQRFIPSEFLGQLNKNSVLDVQLGDQIERNLSVLFADIRGFTALSEHMTPQENFDFINSYLGEMIPAIDAHNGFIDKYIGDAIMALFPHSADDAVRSAIDMLRRLEKYNQERRAAGRVCVEIGIGINSGHSMLGIVGAPRHMEGTVISDTVNLAARVEELTKIYGTPLLISEHTLAQLELPSAYQVRLTDRVTVKGKSNAVTVYEIFDAAPAEIAEAKRRHLADFEQALRAFHRENLREANRLFSQVYQHNPQDRVAAIYLRHCQHLLALTDEETPRILAVDDVQANLLMLSHILEAEQYQVFTAQDGESALALVKSCSPHLILLDIMMPGMDGFEICQQLKFDKTTRDIPIIFMTALTQLDDKLRGFELGAVDYITRPFQIEEVLLRIKTHLTLQNLQRKLHIVNVDLEMKNQALRGRLNHLVQTHGLSEVSAEGSELIDESDSRRRLAQTG